MATTTTTTTSFQSAAQAQQQSQQPPENLYIEDSEKILKELRDELSSSRLKDYQLFANGTAIYEVQLLGAFGSPIGNGTLEIHTKHRFTAAQGYIYNATGIYTPHGELFIIETTN